MTHSFETTIPPETAYKRARQEWDNMIGTATVREANWRIMAFISTACAIVAIIGLIILSNQQTVIPYVIEVQDSGKVRRVGRLAEDSYMAGLTEAVIKRELSQWITDIRQIAGDPIIVQDNWMRAYYYVTAKCRNQLDLYAQTVQPVQRAGAQIISVEVESIISIAHMKTYQIEWTETFFNGEKGQFQGQKKFKGIFSLKIKAPKTEQQLKVNPFGLFIDEYNWQEIPS